MMKTKFTREPGLLARWRPTDCSRSGSHESLVLVVQLCLTLCDPMDCSPPGSSVHGILQPRILEVGSHSLLQRLFFRGSSQPRSPALQADSLWLEPSGEPWKWRKEVLIKRVIRCNSYKRKIVPDTEMVEPVTLLRNKMRTFLWYQQQVSWTWEGGSGNMIQDRWVLGFCFHCGHEARSLMRVLICSKGTSRVLGYFWK